MKEKLEPLGEITKDILTLAAKCEEIIPSDTEDSRVINQALLKLSARIHEITLRIINEEGL